MDETLLLIISLHVNFFLLAWLIIVSVLDLNNNKIVRNLNKENMELLRALIEERKKSTF